MNPQRLPIAIELFAQWRQARGEQSVPSVRPFSRNWDKLQEDAGLVSALDRSEAERDARSLEEAGWLELKSVRYRPHLIERVILPLSSESRWMQAFNFQPPSDAERQAINGFPWTPELSFLREIRTQIPFDDLRRLNAFLLTKSASQPAVPIKERSLQIFGDEKRLDTLLGGALFRDGRLRLEQLDCYLVTEPLGWQRGPSNTGSVIVLENAATWDSYRRWNGQSRVFSAVVYGQGNCFSERVPFLEELFRELGSLQKVFYFGDLDAAGLKIPARASQKALKTGLPPIQPHLPSYRMLLSLSERKTAANEDDPARREDFDWLGELAGEAWQSIGSEHRLAQEWIGWELLQKS
jgi:hypothetical protein